MTNNVCIYHANCADGFMAMTIVRDACGDKYEYVAANYGELPPDVTGKGVLIVDFSYKRDVMLAMADQAQHIIVLDHHESAERELVDMPDNVFVEFDMERSGAMMAWEFIHGPKVGAPLVVHHVQDRDLWQFKISGTKEITAAMFSYPMEYDTWYTWLKNDQWCDTLEREGDALLRKHNKDCAMLCENATRLTIAGHDVPALNVPHLFASECGHRLCKDEPFAAIYAIVPDGVRFSLRSDIKNGTGLNVSEIAEQYGGGGHAAAAGFTVYWDQFAAMLLGD